ncbi:MAG: VWA domain-containing protein [Planctomycetota bacterium]
MTFSFANPQYLFLLVLPAILLAWIWKRTGSEVAVPVDNSSREHSRGWWWTISFAESLPALILGTVIVILAGPQQLSEPKSKRRMTNIEFCVDVSGSMTAQFGEGSRYDGAMKAINQFLEYREGDAFGLTFFSDIALKWVPLTNDVSAFSCAPPFMNPAKRLPPGLGGGTMIGRGLMACRRTLIQRPEGDRMIILISDGASADLGGDRDNEIARQMIADGIVIYGAHIANTNIPDSIVNITTMTGGEVFNPGDPGALDRVFKRIDQMQETKLEKGSAETLDNFFPFCIAGLSLLGTSILTLFGLRYTPW